MRVVMIGNCQMDVMANLYRRFAFKSIGQDVRYIPSYRNVSREHRQALESADVIFVQLVVLQATGELAEIETKAERIPVPLVNCGFLWPFAGQPHPRNPPRGAGGVYGGELSDGYLNRLVKANLDPDEAVAKYLQLDVNKMVSLDRLLEVNLDRQRDRDREAGFDIAPVIEEYFRTEQVFKSPHHPGVRVLAALAEQIFLRLGVDGSDIRRMHRTLRVSPFPDELPVHPAVAAHFGLEWAYPERKYPFLAEGSFTFAQFCRRYLLAEWNATLDAGLEARREGKPCLELLKSALEISPDSAQGHEAYGGALERDGRWQEALPVLQRAVELEPDDPKFRLQWGLLLCRNGEDHAGERQLRIAAALDPFGPHFSTMLAHRLRNRGSPEEAAAVARQGLVNCPYAVSLHVELAYALLALGDADGASASFAEVLRLEDGNFDACRELSIVRERQGRFEEAVELMRRAVAARPNDVFAKVRLASLIEKSGVGDAVVVWAELRDAPVASTQSAHQLAHALKHAGRAEDAIVVLRRGLATYPGSAALSSVLSALLEEAGNLDAALATVSAVQEHHPHDMSLVLRRSSILAPYGQIRGGGTAAAGGDRRPVARRAGLRLLCACALGAEETRRGDRGARTARRHGALPCPLPFATRPCLHGSRAQRGSRPGIPPAIALDSTVGVPHLELSHALVRSGKLDDAIEACRQAVALEPQNARFQHHFGDLLFAAQSFDRARAAFRAALAIDAGNVHTHLQLGRIAVRLGQMEEARDIASDAALRFPDNRAARDFLQFLQAQAA